LNQQRNGGTVTVSGVEPIELRRHLSVGRPRRAGSADYPRGLAHLYAARKRRPLPDLFVTDQAEARGGGGFRWFFSTCLAATVGAVAIAAVIFGSLEIAAGPGRMVSSLRQAFPAAKSPRPASNRAEGGLAWSVPKSDRLQTTMDAISTRYVVQDSIRERRANREYLHKKPYARVVIRLAAVEPDASVAASVPPFNPLKLFAGSSAPNDAPEGGSIATAPEGGEVVIRVVELLGSILPIEDGQEMDSAEVTDLVTRAISNEADRAQIRPSFAPEGLDLARKDRTGGGALAAYTTVLTKSSVETDEVAAEEAEAQRVKVKLGKAETLGKLLVRMGADSWQARDMVEAARGVLPEAAVTPGSEVELTLVPSLSGSGKPEPIRYTVFGAAGEHRVTVERNAAGEFVASATATRPITIASPTESGPQSLSLYNSFYQGALAQGIAPETIQAILKVHAYEADFRRRARGSDAVELFFDLKEEDKRTDGALGELLLTSMTIAGTTQRFYRFKDVDGGVDFYDASGNNSRRFLLRKPVRSDDVRLTSGFGVRFHPLLNQRRLHSGIDWAGPAGTPIVAAGNGTVEEAGYKGQYGNYVRLRHSNGYQTAYGHMRGFAPGISAGVKVRQGQVIGFIGTTGLSSGPHVHFEVLVNSRWVDPLSIQVPREKRLAGRQLAAFQRERVRIDELMRQPPVRVVNVASQH
jgi:murein DD-endopeptidase MepM/ murein hydrolase activator NlpD